MAESIPLTIRTKEGNGNTTPSTQDELDQEQTTPRFRCDRCDDHPEGKRYKCQACQDFDYCEQCVVDAALIHPGHEFKCMGRVQADLTDEGLSYTASAENVNEHECRSCRALTNFLPALSNAVPEKQSQHEAEENDGKRIFLRWQLRISKLVEATQRGCAFCSLIIDKIFINGNFETYSYHPEKSWYSEPENHPKERGKAVTRCMEVLTQLASDEFIFDVTPMSTKCLQLPDFDRLQLALTWMQEPMESVRKARVFPSAGKIALEFDVCAASTDPAAEFISSRPPNPTPTSLAGINRIKEWASDCEENHGATCNLSDTDAPAFLPTRLIEIGANKLHLHKTSPEDESKYIALSYCWGEVQGFQTLAATLLERVSGFDVEALPQTLQDAVQITRTLGVKYLWVDSMCIIQDDPADKAREIGHMAEIYKHAYLTISAARADAASKGFLEDNADPGTGLWKTLIPLKYALPSRDAKTFDEALKQPSRVQGTLFLMDEPISFALGIPDFIEKRAWCLQERILSPRMLSYGRWPTWRCSGTVDSDGGYYRLGGHGRHDDRLTKLLLKTSDAGLESAHKDKLYSDWYQLVSDYTKRELADPADFLPAIGGVATEIARVTSDRYLAGLWESRLLRDVMWSTKTREWLVRPAEWRAPSWSWAAVEAPIQYDGVTDDATPLATVVSCDVVSKHGTSPFGEVSSGRLTIRGMFGVLQRKDVLVVLENQSMIRAPPKSNYVQDWYRQMMEDFGNRPRNGTGQMSHKDAAAALPEKVFGLFTFRRDWWVRNEERVESPCVSGLFLIPCEDGTGYYERIGAFTNEPAPWLDQSSLPLETQEVVIV